MTYETLTALLAFAFVSSITPGPNNMMLMASGTNFGFKKTIPHMLGVSIGFALMLILVGIGLMELFELYPLSQKILKVCSVGFLLYLAYKIATAAPASGGSESTARPMSFIQAVLFQWVNPKAWSMGLTSITLFCPSGELLEIVKVALVFALVNLPSVSLWTIMGQQLRRFLTDPKKLRGFNILMASLLVGSLYLIVGS